MRSCPLRAPSLRSRIRPPWHGIEPADKEVALADGRDPLAGAQRRYDDRPVGQLFRGAFKLSTSYAAPGRQVSARRLHLHDRSAPQVVSHSGALPVVPVAPHSATLAMRRSSRFADGLVLLQPRAPVASRANRQLVRCVWRDGLAALLHQNLHRGSPEEVVREQIWHARSLYTSRAIASGRRDDLRAM